MKIDKLACCLAHPVTALRAIKEKVNEIVDSLEGVSTGGGGGNGGSFIVTATVISMDQGEEGIRMVCESSVRFDEVRANIENNILPTLKLDPGDGDCMFLPLCQFMPNDDTIMFYANIMGIPASAMFTGTDGSENLIVTLGVNS